MMSPMATTHGATEAELAALLRAGHASAFVVEAQYQQQPKGQQRCEICLLFVAPNTCKIVQGPINPKGWCQFFAARENAH